MSYGLFLPRRWTRQPQGPVEIDWGNPLGRQLSSAIIVSQAKGGGADFRNLVANAIPTTYQANGTSQETVAVPGGLGHCTLGYNYSRFVGSRPYNLANTPATLLAVLHYKVPSTTHTVVDTTGGGEAYRRIRFSETSGKIEGLTHRAGSVAVQDGTLSLGQEYRLAFVDDLGSQSLWVNGVKQSTVGTSGTVASQNATWASIQGNGNPTLMWATANRAMSDSELSAWSNAPWQIFKPRRPVIYSFPSGGITIPTLSLPGVQDITATGARPKVTLTF